MRTHYFVLVLDHEPDDEELDKLFEAGCDDAALGKEKGLNIAEFDRHANTREEAISSAITSVESTGLKVIDIKDEI
jgi:hypothetical protein